jgi:RND family efflux transporter MFP subunit
MNPCAARGRLTALAALAATMLAACSPPPSPSTPVPAVFVTPVALVPATGERRFTATVVPRVESELGFRSGGKVAERLVELGDRVKAGQPLARLDPDDARLGTQAALEQVRAAEVDARQAGSDAARFGRLATDDSLPAADAERQRARADAALARVEQARRQLDLARNRQSYTTLVAPFDGIVTSVRLNPGQVVAEGQPLLGLARAGEMELAVDVPEALAGSLATQRARAATTDGKTLPLRLRELAPVAQPVTRSYRARYALAGEAPRDWRLGMTVELRLTQAGAGPRVAELPVAAIVTTGGPPSVWLIADRAAVTLRSAPVEVVAQTTDRVRVRGLAAGDWVVTTGAHKLDAGLRVRPVARPLEAALDTARDPGARP